MRERDLHRREFLAQLGVGAASALAFSGAGVLACGDARDPLVSALEGLFDDPEAARAIGAASGAANPTLTIVALALRLADHLKREFV